MVVASRDKSFLLLLSASVAMSSTDTHPVMMSASKQLKLYGVCVLCLMLRCSAFVLGK